jgi:hypothetical protein
VQPADWRFLHSIDFFKTLVAIFSVYKLNFVLYITEFLLITLRQYLGRDKINDATYIGCVGRAPLQLQLF